MNIYYKRLETFWKSEGCKNANEFAKSLGWERSENIKRLSRNENAKPGLEILEDIAKTYPYFDFNFLITGKKSEEKNLANEPAITTYSCPDCIKKEEEKKVLQDKLHEKEKMVKYCEELLEMYRGKKGNDIANSA